MHINRLCIILATSLAFGGVSSPAREIRANPDNYRRQAATLKPGDVLHLSPGQYKLGLNIKGMHGKKGRPITIRGAGNKTVFVGRPGANTINLTDCSYITIRDLHFDGRGIKYIDAIKAGGNPSRGVHHITIESNVIEGHGGHQQTVAISTKVTAWDWIIRGNTIIGAGTGLYLGNSDGNQPFIRGFVEHNVIKNPKGYCMQIKRQNPRPEDLPGIPNEDAVTLIRYNTFIKDDTRGESGLRPNLLVGAFPPTGPGSRDRYEIYGNLFFHNRGESLFQGTGRLSVHDNVFVDSTENAIHIMTHHGRKPELVRIYHNTMLKVHRPYRIHGMDRSQAIVFGNLFVDEYMKKNGASPIRNARPQLGQLDVQPLERLREDVPKDWKEVVMGEVDSNLDFLRREKPGFNHVGAVAVPGRQAHPLTEKRTFHDR